MRFKKIELGIGVLVSGGTDAWFEIMEDCSEDLLNSGGGSYKLV